MNSHRKIIRTRFSICLIKCIYILVPLTGGCGNSSILTPSKVTPLDSNEEPPASDGSTTISGTATAQRPVRTCKRGIATSGNGGAILSAHDIAVLSPNVAWYYNWGAFPGDANAVVANQVHGMEYIPMAWGGNFDANAIRASLTPNSRYLLTFNEPNFQAQGNLTPAAAAALWPALEKIADQHNLKIVGPAVNYCGGACNQTSPFEWLEQFFAACAGCRVDYLAIHAYVCYGSALNSAYLEPFAKYKKPLWLTEFSCADGSADGSSLSVQKRYMTEAVTALENNPNVYRYAWFLARTAGAGADPISLLAADGSLTELGQLYVSLPANCNLSVE